MPGKGKLDRHRRAAEVMKESAQAAVTCVRSHAPRLGIEDKFFEPNDIHIHFPGAVPQGRAVGGRHHGDGAGVGDHPHPRAPDVAMTGEMTLRGRVTPDRRPQGEAASRRTASASRRSSSPERTGATCKEVPKKMRRRSRARVLVDSVDEVLREALALDKPETFFNRIEGPASVETPAAS